MNTTVYKVEMPGTGGGTWPITDDRLAVEQLLVDYNNPQPCAIQQDEFWGQLGPYGLQGMGQDKVSIPKPQPIPESTMYLVAGVSLLAVAGAILFWMYRKS